jgi:hypothetical protein
MPSPFPGMNPYLEQADVWQDFHQRFISLLRQLLAEQVCPKYLVKIAEQIFIHRVARRWACGRLACGTNSRRFPSLYSPRSALRLTCNLLCTRPTTQRVMRIICMPLRPRRHCKARMRRGRSG